MLSRLLVLLALCNAAITPKGPHAVQQATTTGMIHDTTPSGGLKEQCCLRSNVACQQHFPRLPICPDGADHSNAGVNRSIADCLACKAAAKKAGSADPEAFCEKIHMCGPGPGPAPGPAPGPEPATDCGYAPVPKGDEVAYECMKVKSGSAFKCCPVPAKVPGASSLDQCKAVCCCKKLDAHCQKESGMPICQHAHVDLSKPALRGGGLAMF